MTSIKFLRTSAVLAARGIGHSTHYSHIAAGLFVPPVKLGARASAYPQHEVMAIDGARVAGASEADIRLLVAKLIEARKGAALN